MSLWSSRLANEATFDVIALASFLGAAFSGYQEQPSLAGNYRFVQSELEMSLARAVGLPRVTLLAASRTDAGVHARALLVRASLPASVLSRLVDAGGPEGLLGLWNTALCGDVRIARLRWAAPSQIHLRDAARGKAYSFYVRGGSYAATLSAAPFSMHVAAATSHDFAARVAAALDQLVGMHDFSPFAMGRGGGGGGAAATRTLASAVASVLPVDHLDADPLAPPPRVDAGTRFYASDAKPALPLPLKEIKNKNKKRLRSESVEGSGGGGGAGSVVVTTLPAIAVASLPTIAAASAITHPHPPGLLRLRFVANGFLRHQVRLMVGAALAVGAGDLPLDFCKATLANTSSSNPNPNSGANHFRAAAPRGLWLEETLLPSTFWVDDDWCNNRDEQYLVDKGLKKSSWAPKQIAHRGITGGGGKGKGGGDGSGAEEDD